MEFKLLKNITETKKKIVTVSVTFVLILVAIFVVNSLTEYKVAGHHKKVRIKNKNLIDKISKLPKDKLIKIKNNLVYSSPLETKNSRVNKGTIRLRFENIPIQLDSNIYAYRGRYYLPLGDFLEKINGKYNNSGDISTLSLNNIEVEFNYKENIFIKNNIPSKLMKNCQLVEDNIYISLIDLVKMFNLIVNWNLERSELALYNNKNVITPQPKMEGNQPALIRLEDYSADLGQDRLEKDRIIADYLYSKNVPFHVTWIPRYINPAKNIDNDPSKDFNMYNIQFVYTLDYFILKNGVIGLHGYTHQYGNEVSGIGFEFGEKINNTPEKTIELFNLAIESAKNLDIPVNFFEFPHYSASKMQYNLAEEKFNYIYGHTYEENHPKIKSFIKGSRNVKYVPTPLDYVSTPDGRDMINRINRLSIDSLGSLFFHPFLEYNNITIAREENGYPRYNYSQKSILHNIINTMEQKKFKFRKITEL